MTKNNYARYVLSTHATRDIAFSSRPFLHVTINIFIFRILQKKLSFFIFKLTLLRRMLAKTQSIIEDP